MTYQELYDEMQSALSTSYTKHFVTALEIQSTSSYEQEDLKTIMGKEISEETLEKVFEYITKKMRGDFQYCRYTDFVRRFCPNTDLWEGKGITL